MPHRVNTKGDIGTAKNASDSYDADNIYLSEEGWVYRHFKNEEKTRWWDEIIVAGQVKEGVDIHGVANAPMTQTNPLKLGTETAVGYQTGDGEFDIMYANLGGDPELAHMEALESVIIDPADKVYDPGASYRIPDDVQGVPAGWTDVSDPSNVENYPDEPPYPGEDTFVAPANEYNVQNTPLPTSGYDADPQGVVQGISEGGTGAGDVVSVAQAAGGSTDSPTPSPDPSPSPSPSPDPATPVAVEGYYPLYTTEADANAHAGGDGTAHTHELSGSTYYMPNGLTLGVDMFHGDYGQTGQTGGGGSSY